MMDEKQFGEAIARAMHGLVWKAATIAGMAAVIGACIGRILAGVIYP